jgi:hypothetical protein
MNRSLETVLRFVNVTTSGFLAGSLGFGESESGAPGSPNTRGSVVRAEEGAQRYVTAIGPLALAASVTLAIAAKREPLKRTLDVLSTLSLAGVVVATMLGTAPLNRKIDNRAPRDYPNDESAALVRSWSRAQAVRTALGISAFVLSVASNVTAAPSR